MKELKYLFAVGLLIAFNSCREDTFEQQVTPAQTGDEITFWFCIDRYTDTYDLW